MPEISKESIKELCYRLPAIDLIDIENDYSISCFLFASDMSFEESVIPQSTTKSSKEEKSKYPWEDT